MSARLDRLSAVTTTLEGTSPAIEPLMTPPQLAERLGVPRSWVYEKAALGVIPSIKVGVYRRFRWSDVEDWLSEMNA